MNKKSIIFTLDAILAILIAGVMITSSYFYISQTKISQLNRQNLYKISLDVLTILEKDGTLYDSVRTGSTSDLNDFLNLLPAQICGSFTIYDHESNVIQSVQKADCDTTQPVFSRRVFVGNNFDIYYAEAKLGFS